MQQSPETAALAKAASVPEWESLGLSELAVKLVRAAGFEKPSPVQAQAIPIALEGHDVIASAQTGTGKTASFVLPMVERIAGRQGTYGLILAPTREIAQQIHQTIEAFGAPRGVRSIVLIGGVNMRIDAEAIQSYPQILVATPGRLCDHLDRGNVWLEFIEVVVLDEADRMLDMGFSTQLSRIMEEVPKQRQTMLFSATIPPPVEKLAHRILHNPQQVTIGKPMSAVKQIEQTLLWLREEDKMRELRRLIRDEPGSIMIFTRSKDGATRVWRALHSAGVYDATYIHSDRLQAHRQQALAEFKEGKYRILVATDVAGRGIHVDEVAHVINYDLPVEAENYVHRIGRTGRAGLTGKSTTFATARDRSTIRQIEKLLGHSIPATNEMPEGSSSSGHSTGHSGGASGRSSGRHSSEPSRERPRPTPSGKPSRTIAARTGPAPAAPLDRESPAPVSSQGVKASEPAQDEKGAAGSGRKRRRGGRGGRGGGAAGAKGPAAPK